MPCFWLRLEKNSKSRIETRYTVSILWYPSASTLERPMLGDGCSWLCHAHWRWKLVHFYEFSKFSFIVLRCFKLILSLDSKSRAVAMRGTLRCYESESLLDKFELSLCSGHHAHLSDICTFGHAALGGFERHEGMAKDKTFWYCR